VREFFSVQEADMNFLEQLVAEWYEWQGYFVCVNRKYGKRPGGGWTGEADVLACQVALSGPVG